MGRQSTTGTNGPVSQNAHRVKKFLDVAYTLQLHNVCMNFALGIYLCVCVSVTCIFKFNVQWHGVKKDMKGSGLSLQIMHKFITNKRRKFRGHPHMANHVYMKWSCVCACVCVPYILNDWLWSDNKCGLINQQTLNQSIYWTEFQMQTELWIAYNRRQSLPTVAKNSLTNIGWFWWTKDCPWWMPCFTV